MTRLYTRRPSSARNFVRRDNRPALEVVTSGGADLDSTGALGSELAASVFQSPGAPCLTLGSPRLRGHCIPAHVRGHASAKTPRRSAMPRHSRLHHAMSVSRLSALRAPSPGGSESGRLARTGRGHGPPPGHPLPRPYVPFSQRARAGGPERRPAPLAVSGSLERADTGADRPRRKIPSEPDCWGAWAQTLTAVSESGWPQNDRWKSPNRLRGSQNAPSFHCPQASGSPWGRHQR